MNIPNLLAVSRRGFHRHRLGRRLLALVLSCAQFALAVGGLVLLTPSPALAALLCATPGHDGAGGTLATQVNSYYPGTASAAAGVASTTISVGTKTGAGPAIASGDLLLVIQISGATINSTNTTSYGAGTGTSRGITAINQVGKFEYVKATGTASTTVPITGAGANGGLVNAYTFSSSTASPAEFEVVRVPQYTTATLGSSLTGLPWQFASGTSLTGTGGIIAIDVSGVLTLGGTVLMTGQGFTAGHNIAQSTTTTLTAYSDVLSSATNLTNKNSLGEKGEGIAGAPRYTMPYTTAGVAGTAEDLGATIGDFLPTGGAGGGSPGNAGGGGTWFTSSKGGGGGGANGGAGGTGGSSAGGAGGKAGTAVVNGATLVYLGGGGGSGDIYAGLVGSGDGGSGGGIVLIRALSVTGSGTITSNGLPGVLGTLSKTDSGGSGAGGTVMVTTTTGSLTGLTVNAKGGGGGAAGTSIEGGGGGGGGASLLSSAATSVTVSGGAASTGDTTGPATAGSTGTTSVAITPGSIPGISSGAECSTAQMTIVPPAGHNVTPSSIVTDTFTLTNTTASGTGTFQVTSGASFTGTAPASTLVGYVLAGLASGTCSIAVPCNLATLNGAGELSVGGIAASGGNTTVGVVYSVSGSATAAETIKPSISATIAIAGDTTSAAAANAAYTDTVLAADARLDVETSVVGPTSSGSLITWTVTANNGGPQAGLGLSSAKTALGITYPGAVIFLPVPSFGGVYLAIQSLPALPTLNPSGLGISDSSGVYYNTAACSTHPTSGWVLSTAWSGAECIAIYVQNSGATVLPSAPSGSSGAGAVTPATAQITFTFTTNQPTGVGSGNANSVTLLASGAVGGSDTGEPILGQGVAANTLDASTGSLVNGIQTNLTSSSGIIPPGGASNSIGTQAYPITATMTITDPSVQNVTPSMTATDTFILTNTTASGTGTFQVTSGASFTGTATAPTVSGYVLAGLASGTCSIATPCNLATLNGAGELLAGGVAPSGGTKTVGVVYQVSSTATSGQTILPSISVTIAISGDTTSTAAANTAYTDTVIAVRLDIQTSVVGATTLSGAGSTIAWTVKANNGGTAAGYQNLVGADDMSPDHAAGVLIVMQLPNFGGSVLGMTGTPTVALNGLNGSVTSELLYSIQGSNPTSWSTTYNASATWLGVIVYYTGQTGLYLVLPSATGGSSGAGSVSTAQITISFSTNQPSGSGAGNAGSVTLLANSIVADSSGYLLAPGLAAGTQDTAVGTTEGTYDNTVESNVTPGSGTIAPGGASLLIGSQAFDTLPLIGPVGALGATGSFDGVSGVNTNDAFTAVSYTPAGGAALVNTGTTPGTPVGTVVVTSGITTVNVPNALTYQEVFAGGTLSLLGIAPTGWKVQICQDSSGPVCTISGIWTTISAPATVVTSVLTLTSLQSLSNYKFWAVYTLATASNVTPFARQDASVAANDGTTSTAVTTHNELYPGFVPLTKTVTVSSTGCGGVTPPAGGVCPGGMLLYTIDYRNIAIGGTGGTEPESAFPETAAGTLVLTENGAYLANTNGLNEALVAGANGTTTFGDTAANSTFIGNTVGSTSFTDRVGGASFKLVPTGFTGTNKGQQGTLMFRVVVK